MCGLLAARQLPRCRWRWAGVGYNRRLPRASTVEYRAPTTSATPSAYGVPRRRIVFRYALRLEPIPVLAVPAWASAACSAAAVP